MLSTSAFTSERAARACGGGGLQIDAVAGTLESALDIKSLVRESPASGHGSTGSNRGRVGGVGTLTCVCVCVVCVTSPAQASMVEEEAVRACGAQAAQLLMLTPDEKFFWSPHHGMEARFHIQDVRVLSPPCTQRLSNLFNSCWHRSERQT